MAAASQEAFQHLGPISWNEIAAQTPARRREYLNQIFQQARLLIESVPPPPPPHPPISPQVDGRAGATIPFESRAEVLALQREWGQPLKTSAKDNPLDIPVYTLRGQDGRGAWFGRRSIHRTGMGFSRWKAKMQWELDETLRVNRERGEKGLPPGYCVRGIGVEEKVEDVEVLGENGETPLGRIEVLHVSAQFPRPTASRDFVEMVITSDRAGLDLEGEKKKNDADAAGRSLLVVSKPCEHPDVPLDRRYIRGQYESVEVIREIPMRQEKPGSASLVARASSPRRNQSEINLVRNDLSASPGSGQGTVAGRKRGKPDSAARDMDAVADEAENPVEWIMITRTDPGGNLPRWMVEKGTPRSIANDVKKFIDWASHDTDESQQADKEGPAAMWREEGITAQANTTHATGFKDEEPSQKAEDDSAYPAQQQHTGLIATVADAVNAGIDKYAPQALKEYIPWPVYPEDPGSDELADSSESDDKFKSPDLAGKKHSQRGSGIITDDITSARSDSYSSVDSSLAMQKADDTDRDGSSSADILASMKQGGKRSLREKQLLKLAERRRDVAAQVERVRVQIESLSVSSELPAASARKKDADGSLPAAKPKPVSNLQREEAKLIGKLRKIGTQQRKTAAKVEARQRKQAERDERTRSRSEVEALRREVKGLKKEVSKLRAQRDEWIDLLGHLQAENTMLVAEKGSE